jgi:beta-glucosidase
MEFYWGAATSAYQVEGGNKNDWSESGFDAGKSADHYNRFKDDFDLAKSLGHNAHRFSIEWSRIEPEEGKFNLKELDHYQKVVNALRAQGMEPFVTIWHFTNPVWFAELGGWQNKKAPEYFARYADFLSKNLGNSVNYWVTINEPMVYAANAYFRGVWPPQKKFSAPGYFKVVRNLANAHKLAYQVIRKNDPGAKVGIAKNNISSHQDFIGLNYYFHRHPTESGFGGKETHPVSDLGWGIYPEGLYMTIKDLQKYKKPIFITENGLADAKDKKRAQFIKDHIFWMKKAMAEGVDVRGYFHWSLIDNYEWDKGFDPRFGMVGVDYSNMKRRIRDSALEYKKIIEKEGYL